MGASVAMVGWVGSDAFGRELKHSLRDQGVSTRWVGVDSERSTGAALIEVDEHGENSIAVATGANTSLLPAGIPRSVVQRADVISAVLEVPLESIAEAFRLARLADVRTVLTAAPAQPVPAALLRLTDVVICNQHELGALLGQTVNSGEEAQAAMALRRAAHQVSNRSSDRGSDHATDQLVVVTLGERGALAVAGDQTFQQSSFRVRSVDSVGAGDAFAAGFVCGRWWSAGVQAALRLGCAAGALATTKPGAQPAMPTLAEVRVLLDV
jgi:ribokinase